MVAHWVEHQLLLVTGGYACEYRASLEVCGKGVWVVVTGVDTLLGPEATSVFGLFLVGVSWRVSLVGAGCGWFVGCLRTV